MTYEIISKRTRKTLKIKNPSDFFTLLKRYAKSRQEQFFIITLNGAHEIIGVHIATIGLVKCRIPPGAESHSFEPSPRDIIAIQNSDIFIYIGGESEKWVERILQSMNTDKMKILSLMDTVDVVEEEIVEGMLVMGNILPAVYG